MKGNRNNYAKAKFETRKLFKICENKQFKLHYFNILIVMVIFKNHRLISEIINSINKKLSSM